MIISKDLFIFGEHLFGTILPESSNSTNTTSASQQTLLQLPPTTIVLPSSTASGTSSSSSALFTPLSSCSIDERGAVANNIITPATSPSSQVLSSQQQQQSQQQHKHCNCYRHYQHRQQQQHQLLPINNLITLKRNNGDDSNDTTITIQQSTMRYINEELSQQRQSVNMTTNYKHMSNIHHHPHDEAVSLLTNNKTKTTTMEVNDISVKEQCKDCVLQEQNDILKRSAAVSYNNGDIEQNHLKPTSTVTIQNPVNNNNSVDNNTTTTAPLIIETQRTLQLSFQNLTIMHNDRKILDDISGGVSPAEILAIMGPSGSGKTTLLDCLSGQRRLDSGTIFVNRELLSKKWRRKICYVLQEEIFFAGLTLRETLTYTALLRLPEHLPKSQKINLVEEILQAFDLTFCQHTKFGDYLNRGLSGGEKKRANIACELLTSPLLMLLDEPTSGLDSHSAVSLMKMLKRYATQEQKTVVITVHQPSSQMFHMFDKLLLLFNGRTAYFGEANSIYRYFENIGVIIKPRYNPAEFLLEQLKSYPDVREKLFLAAKESLGNYFNGICLTLNENHKNHSFITNCSKRDHDNGDNKDGIKHDALINDIINNYYKTHHHGGFHDHHKHHHHNIVIHPNSCVEDATQQLWYGGGADTQSNVSSTSSDYPNNDWLDYPTGFYTQFYVLSERNFKEAKPRMLSKLNWLQTVGLALMAGAIWFRIPRTEEYLHDLQGWMFFSQTYWMLFALFGALNSFPAEREIINKERRSGAYRLSAYYLAKMFAELPLIIALPTIYLMISYPMLGCPSVKLFLLMLAFLLLNTIVAQSVGFFIGACCMDMNFSITLSALYTLATQLFGGYLSTRIPDCLSWIRYTSMIHYAYQNMQILEFSEAPFIECGHPSSYEVCKNNGTLYIPYEEILKAQNSTSPLWLNTVVLLIFFMVFRSFGYIVLRYIRCPKM